MRKNVSPQQDIILPPAFRPGLRTWWWLISISIWSAATQGSCLKVGPIWYWILQWEGTKEQVGGHFQQLSMPLHLAHSPVPITYWNTATEIPVKWACPQPLLYTQSRMCSNYPLHLWFFMGCPICLLLYLNDPCWTWIFELCQKMNRVWDEICRMKR